MKPAEFEYYAPTTTTEVLSLLRELGDEAKLLAGGQSLVPMMNFRLARPAHLIDLNGVAELKSLTVSQGSIAIGAMVRQRRLERDAAVDGWPLLTEACGLIGHVQIRNRGTIGGSLCHSDPAAELPAAMRALNAEFVVERAGDKRVVRSEEFFVDLLTTCLDPSELLTEVRVPLPPRRSGSAFLEISRRHGDFALVGIAAIIALDKGGSVESARVVLTGVGATPVLCEGAETPLLGQLFTEARAREAAAIATHELRPESDIHASADYRKEIAGVLVRRALTLAVDRARSYPENEQTADPTDS